MKYLYLTSPKKLTKNLSWTKRKKSPRLMKDLASPNSQVENREPNSMEVHEKINEYKIVLLGLTTAPTSVEEEGPLWEVAEGVVEALLPDSFSSNLQNNTLALVSALTLPLMVRLA
jgi:hypothetical protein